MRKWEKYMAIKTARKSSMNIFAYAGQQVFIKNIIGNGGVWYVGQPMRFGLTLPEVVKLTNISTDTHPERKSYYVDRRGHEYLLDQGVTRDWCHGTIDIIVTYDESFKRIARRVTSHSGVNCMDVFAFHLPFNRKSNYVRRFSNSQYPRLQISMGGTTT